MSARFLLSVPPKDGSSENSSIPDLSHISPTSHPTFSKDWKREKQCWLCEAPLGRGLIRNKKHGCKFCRHAVCSGCSPHKQLHPQSQKLARICVSCEASFDDEAANKSGERWEKREAAAIADLETRLKLEVALRQSFECKCTVEGNRLETAAQEIATLRTNAVNMELRVSALSEELEKERKLTGEMREALEKVGTALGWTFTDLAEIGKLTEAAVNTVAGMKNTIDAKCAETERKLTEKRRLLAIAQTDHTSICPIAAMCNSDKSVDEHTAVVPSPRTPSLQFDTVSFSIHQHRAQSLAMCVTLSVHVCGELQQVSSACTQTDGEGTGDGQSRLDLEAASTCFPPDSPCYRNPNPNHLPSLLSSHEEPTSPQYSPSEGQARNTPNLRRHPRQASDPPRDSLHKKVTERPPTRAEDACQCIVA